MESSENSVLDSSESTIHDVMETWSDSSGKINVKDLLTVIDKIDQQRSMKRPNTKPILTASGRREAKSFMKDHPTMKMSLKDFVQLIETGDLEDAPILTEMSYDINTVRNSNSKRSISSLQDQFNNEKIYTAEGLSPTTLSITDNIPVLQQKDESLKREKHLRGKEIRLEYQLENLEQDLADYQTKIDDLNNQVNEKKREIRKVQALADEQAQVISQLEREMSNAISKGEEWQAKAVKLEQSNKLAQEDIANKDQIIEELAAEKNNSNSLVSKDNSLQKIREEEISEFTSQIDYYSEILDKIEEEQKDHEKIQNEYTQLKQKNDSVEMLLIEYKENNANLELKLKNQRASLAASESKCNSYLEKIQQLEQQIQQVSTTDLGFTSEGIEAYKQLSKRKIKKLTGRESDELFPLYQILERESRGVRQVLKNFLAKSDQGTNLSREQLVQNLNRQGQYIPVLYTIVIFVTTILLLFTSLRFFLILSENTETELSAF